MAFLEDVLRYNSNTECPEPYLVWSGLSLLGACIGRRFWTMHGRFRIHGNLYVCLVGTAGSGKSTARGFAKTIFVAMRPDWKVSASIQSREDIADQMAMDDCMKTWPTNPKEGEAINEFRPFYINVGELPSLLSVDKEKMVEFLTDVFDENHFSTGFKGQRNKNPEQKQHFDNPYVSLLACATPEWFMDNLKLDLFKGGLGRRLVIVNSEKHVLIDDPCYPPGSAEVMVRIVNHLSALEPLHGELKRTKAAWDWWREWYYDPTRFNYDDPILYQFHQTKHIQLLKTALLLALCDTPIETVIDVHHLIGALKMLTSLEGDVIKLTRGIGRNEIAGISASMLDFVERRGGACSEEYMRKFYWKELQIPEINMALSHFVATKQLFLYNVKWNSELTGKLEDLNVYMTPYFANAHYKAWADSPRYEPLKPLPPKHGLVRGSGPGPLGVVLESGSASEPLSLDRTLGSQVSSDTQPPAVPEETPSPPSLEIGGS